MAEIDEQFVNRNSSPPSSPSPLTSPEQGGDKGETQNLKLEGRRVLMGIGGGIAAYKVCDVISTLFKAGVQELKISNWRADEF